MFGELSDEFSGEVKTLLDREGKYCFSKSLDNYLSIMTNIAHNNDLVTRCTHTSLSHLHNKSSQNVNNNLVTMIQVHTHTRSCDRKLLCQDI